MSVAPIFDSIRGLNGKFFINVYKDHEIGGISYGGCKPHSRSLSITVAGKTNPPIYRIKVTFKRCS